MFKTALVAPPQTVEGIVIRLADEEDIEVILDFIKQLADFEKLSDEVTVDAATLAENLFGAHPYAECLIADMDGAPAGFALFLHSFSPYQGRPNLNLEGLFVKSEYRNAGIGMQLIRELATIALERDCLRMEWRALDWNIQNIIFYRKLGAQPLANCVTQRLDREQIEALAEEPAA